MTAKRIFKIVSGFAKEIVFFIGLMTIIGWARDQWPLAVDATMNIVVAVFLGGLFWMWFVKPFLAGLRGDPSKDV